MSNRLTQIALDFGPEHAAPPPAPAVVVAETIAQPPLTQYIETAGVVVRIKTLKNPPVAVVTPPASAAALSANGAQVTSSAAAANAVNGSLAASAEPVAPQEELPALPRFINAELFPIPPVEEPEMAAGSGVVEEPEAAVEPELIAEPQPAVEPEPIPEPEPAVELEHVAEPTAAVETEPVAEPAPAPAPEAELAEPAAALTPAEEPTAVAEPAPAAEEPAIAAAGEPIPAAEPDPVPEFRTKNRRTTGATATNGTTSNGTAAKAAKSAKPAVSKRGRKSLKQVSAEADLIEIPNDDVLFSKQYYTMGEVSEMFRVNQSLLRFWETEFDILQPRKNKKGDRYFRPVDIKNLHLIYHLLRQKKFTIEGAKEFLKKNKKAEERFEIVQRLQEIRSFLLEWKAQL